MGRGHKIYIMSTLCNEIMVNLLQMRYSNFFAEAFTTDFIILAKNTMQVAAAKKNSAGTARAADARFLVKMQRDPRQHGIAPHAAKARARRRPRRIAATRALIAIKRFQ